MDSASSQAHKAPLFLHDCCLEHCLPRTGAPSMSHLDTGSDGAAACL